MSTASECLFSLINGDDMFVTFSATESNKKACMVLQPDIPLLSIIIFQFCHMSKASECLFSLINGHDMFVTFSATESNNELVRYYSRIYLYLALLSFSFAT